ncbi:hypothetical protein DOTSEDRAFT_35999 [Dothistroma septosporum NZE10]|uniref:Uncharacterized protein n=1 Tax=Dothistroma septosporum (strain NZE10 / CBS 128990) TaxID=675120 RepID=N1PIV7_DOTSN|nr:hypothetical protein DOTSEDRAFT_35999 [Dothistroma septosporum NZE10]
MSRSRPISSKVAVIAEMPERIPGCAFIGVAELIEKMLLGLPLPEILLAQRVYPTWKNVIDVCATLSALLDTSKGRLELVEPAEGTLPPPLHELPAPPRGDSRCLWTGLQR